MTVAEDASVSQIVDTFVELKARAGRWFEREGITSSARVLRRTVDIRYAGQNYGLRVVVAESPPGPAIVKALVVGFERAHEQMYGYIVDKEPVQIVTFRLEAAATVTRAGNPRAPAGDISSVGRRDRPARRLAGPR